MQIQNLLLATVLGCGVNKDLIDTASEEGSTVQDDTNDTNDTNDGPDITVESDMVDSECIDGQYSESSPTSEADISAPMNSYSPGDVHGFILDVLDIRFPVGRAIYEGGYTSQGPFPDNCLNYFLGDASSGQAIIGQMSTLVHECGHFYDIASSGWGDSVYHITGDLSFTCSDGSVPDNGGGVTFARSLISTDEYADLHPPCANYTDQGCDSYAAIYLNGSPYNGSFESGDQGFNMLHEETLQYVNSLATGFAFQNDLSYSVSERDGILTFLWYTMRYLRMARLEYPQAYALLSEDDCWRELILTTWGRAWLFLELTENSSNLGLNDDFLMELVQDQSLLDEIQRLRAIQGCE